MCSLITTILDELHEIIYLCPCNKLLKMSFWYLALFSDEGDFVASLSHDPPNVLITRWEPILYREVNMSEFVMARLIGIPLQESKNLLCHIRKVCKRIPMVANNKLAYFFYRFSRCASFKDLLCWFGHGCPLPVSHNDFRLLRNCDHV